jgi:hypothetical protein
VNILRRLKWIQAIFLLVALSAAALTLVAFVIELVEYVVLANVLANPNSPIAEEAIASLERMDRLLAILYQPHRIVLIAVSLVWFSWLYNSMKLLHVSGIEGLEHSPRMAVIWNFIPIMQLWKPLYVNLEIADATQGNADWKSNRPSKLALFCSFFIAVRILLNRAYAQLMQPSPIDGETLLILNIFTDALSLIVLLSVPLFVRRIFHAQKRLVENLPNDGSAATTSA